MTIFSADNQSLSISLTDRQTSINQLRPLTENKQALPEHTKPIFHVKIPVPLRPLSHWQNGRAICPPSAKNDWLKDTYSPTSWNQTPICHPWRPHYGRGHKLYTDVSFVPGYSLIPRRACHSIGPELPFYELPLKVQGDWTFALAKMPFSLTFWFITQSRLGSHPPLSMAAWYAVTSDAN